ncbi:hypothetical protein FBU30_006748 [Linnemannia zychae]|nr:hypothetical protein FBU30_006748 [Linnemannia zychae]
MNKHLQQPASMGLTGAEEAQNEQLSNPPKHHHIHGASTQSTFKVDPNKNPNEQSSERIEAEKGRQHSTTKKTAGSHPQK